MSDTSSDPDDRSARGGHVYADATSRTAKARKIEAILGRAIDLGGADVLDLGAGSGRLSAYLKPRVRSIVAADRDTAPFAAEGVDIHRTPGSDLPFADRAFDAVIFNHVIEHVGDRAEQGAILHEIARVLRPGGVLYLAVPNRFALIEPHYKLPFLSWLPQSLADAWVRATGKNDWYDCNPFRYGELVRHLRRQGFLVEDSTARAFRELVRIELAGRPLGRVLSRVPEVAVRLARPVMPTFVVLCRPEKPNT